MKKTDTLRLLCAAICLALALILPFLTGQIPQIGSMLLPMHLPVLLCGFICGAPYGLAVGLIAPLLRSAIFAMPPMIPTAVTMAFELAAYGAVSGFLYARLPRKPANVYVSLILAMLCGRIIWGLVSIPVYAMLMSNGFSIALFWTGGFVKAWPGIVAQLILVPGIVFALEKAKRLPLRAGQAGART